MYIKGVNKFAEVLTGRKWKENWDDGNNELVGTFLSRLGNTSNNSLGRHNSQFSFYTNCSLYLPLANV